MKKASIYTRRSFLRAASLGAGALALSRNTRAQSQDKRPNIVLILADDMGYSDIGCYGGEIATPNLDKLAENGLRFTQFYNAARCCPTRAALMTGLHPHQTGIGHMTNPPNTLNHDKSLRSYRGFLNRECATLAEVLRPAGYHTLMAGKWHLGFNAPDRWPLQRGFDKFYGIISGGANYFKPEYPRGLTLGNDPAAPGEGFYMTDAFTGHAIQFVREAGEEDRRPFFLYLAFNAPHWPLHAKKKDIDKYRGKYSEGWDVLRASRLKRMIDLGIIDKDWALSGRDARAWDELDEAKKTELDLRMAIYAAQIDCMDQNIGRLVAALKTLGKLDNTLILFLSDNGGCAEGGELGGGKAEDLESDRGWVLSYGRAWANASNTPFRRYKHWVHEGGIATPLIAHWPQGMPAKRNGALTHRPGQLIDIMPTCVELAQADYPAQRHGYGIPPMEGESLAPLLRGKDVPIRESPLFWEHEGNRALRRGKWKLVARHGAPWELFDMDADRTETNDLAESQTQLAQSLAARHARWAKRVGVAPWPVKNK